MVDDNLTKTAEKSQSEEEQNLDIYNYDEIHLDEFISIFSGVNGGLSGAWERWNKIVSVNPKAKHDIFNILLPFSLLFYSSIMISLLFIFDVNLVSESLSNSTIINIFLVDTVFVVIVSSILFYKRNLKLIRWPSLFLQFFPLVIIAPVVFAIISGNPSIISSVVSSVNQSFSPISSSFSSLNIPGISTFYDIMGLGNTSLLMFFVGLVTILPFFMTIFKSIIRGLSTTYADMPEVGKVDRNVNDLITFTKSNSEFEINEAYDINGKELLEINEKMRDEPYEDYKEIKRYWLRSPYSYAKILYNEKQGDYRYFIEEPDIDEEREQLIIEEFIDRINSEILFEDVEYEEFEDEQREKMDILENKIIDISKEYGIRLNNETFHKVLYYIERDQVLWGKIDPLMSDPNIEEISCDGHDVPVFIFHRHYQDLMTNLKFDRESLRSYIIQLAQRSGEHISIANPLVEASLPDGSRAQLSISKEVTTRGSTFTIRKFQDIPFTPVDLIKSDTFNIEQMAYLWMAIQHDKSLIFAGGTASGKTTSMNAVSLFIPPKAKIVSLEDTRELSLPHQNWIPSLTRENFGGETGSDIGMYNLLRAALRQRPEYLIVGEIRGEEAKTLFQAMSTGHTTYSTMHADSASSALSRLENPPINVPRELIDALDILCIQRQIRVKDEEGEIQNKRKNFSIVEPKVDQDQAQANDVYNWDAERETVIDRRESSRTLEEIREDQGWTQQELEEELEKRKKVLSYLVENNIDNVRKVVRTIQAFMSDDEMILKQIEEDTLKPEQFRDITTVKFNKEKDNELIESEFIEDIELIEDKTEEEQPELEGEPEEEQDGKKASNTGDNHEK